MTAASPQEVTRLLAAWSDGDEAALEQLVPIIHAELRRLARHYLKRERPGHTLQTSALVNEAYVRLINWKTARFESRARASFFIQTVAAGTKRGQSTAMAAGSSK